MKIQKHAPKQFSCLSLRWNATCVKAVISSCKHAAYPWYVNCWLWTVLLRFTQWQKPTITDGLFFYRLFGLSAGHLNKNLLQPTNSVTPLDTMKCCARQLRNLANVHEGNTKLSTSLMRCYSSIGLSLGAKR